LFCCVRAGSTDRPCRLEREALLKKVAGSFEMKQGNQTEKLASMLQEENNILASGVERLVDHACCVCSGMTAESKVCECGLVWYCSRAHKMAHREEHARDCRNVVCANEDRKFKQTLTNLPSSTVGGDGGDDGRRAATSSLSYTEMAPAGAVASLSDWDYYFEKRGLPSAWAAEKNTYEKGQLATTPMGSSRQAYLDWRRQSQAVDTAAAAGLDPKDQLRKEQEQQDQQDQRLQRLTSDALSLPLVILRALQAVDFDRYRLLRGISVARPIGGQSTPYTPRTQDTPHTSQPGRSGADWDLTYAFEMLASLRSCDVA
jgi:hypothetical protein